MQSGSFIQIFQKYLNSSVCIRHFFKKSKPSVVLRLMTHYQKLHVLPNEPARYPKALSLVLEMDG